MEESQVNANFEEFIKLLRTNIKRDGIENLIKWLESKDTKIAPASTKYHNAFPGGLVEHCLNVYRRLKKLMAMEYPTVTKTTEEGVEYVENTCPYSEETIALVALLHDIAKVNFYEVQERNTKDENGQWIKVPFYSVKKSNERLLFGDHPTNSFYMISKFVKLTYEEELAIMYHEGAFDINLDGLTLSRVMDVFKRSPLALLLHTADIMSTSIDEVGENE